MKRVFIGILLIAVIASGIWVGKHHLPGLKQANPKSNELVDKLKGLYQQTEEIESKIRALQSQGKPYETEQHALELVRESIESTRSEVRQTSQEPQPTPPESPSFSKVLAKLKFIPRRTIMAGLGVVAFFLLIFLISALRRHLFGQKMKPKPFTRVMPVVRKPRPAPVHAAPAPVADEDDQSESSEQDDVAHQQPVRNIERAPSITMNEQILDLHRQGLNIKEISNRLKVGLDQVALVVRLQAKD
jgi:hypothetical protein